ncbi:MAG: hypothetical protein MJ245_04430 [Clostridia bacterium]|nr:hypothetical protein [Clostridia bacterium]
MVETIMSLKDKYKDYKNKDTKIAREAMNGNLIKLKNGLYETDKNTDPMYLASLIYGPSYLSFEYALYYYDMIPERAYKYSSATSGKRKKKVFNNAFGCFMYQDIPEEVYPLGVNLIYENGYTYQIASKEKALCDELYINKPVYNLSDMEKLLLDDLRIDEDELLHLNYDDICIIEKYYHSTNVSLFKKYMKRRLNIEYSN